MSFPSPRNRSLGQLECCFGLGELGEGNHSVRSEAGDHSREHPAFSTDLEFPLCQWDPHLSDIICFIDVVGMLYRRVAVAKNMGSDKDLPPK